MKYLKTKSNYTYTTIKGEDPHSDPIKYIPVCHPVTYTGIALPISATGTYEWKIITSTNTGDVVITGTLTY